ncbi:MAG: hypothetical protein ACOC2H_07345 [Spirochaetota bacterium]
MEDIAAVFTRESAALGRAYVRINESRIVQDDTLLHIDLGSCVSVVLCGQDKESSLWIGANHLYKSRQDNMDLSLQQVATLYNMFREKNVTDIRCIGLFGGGYKEKSLARNVATMNIKTILETLDIFNLSIELFQTGFSQSISVYHSRLRDSIIVRHRELKTGSVQFFEIPLHTLFTAGNVSFP